MMNPIELKAEAARVSENVKDIVEHPTEVIEKPVVYGIDEVQKVIRDAQNGSEEKKKDIKREVLNATEDVEQATRIPYQK